MKTLKNQNPISIHKTKAIDILSTSMKYWGQKSYGF